MNKEKLLKDIKTFLEIYQTLGDKVAWSWIRKELDKYE